MLCPPSLVMIDFQTTELYRQHWVEWIKKFYGNISTSWNIFKRKIISNPMCTICGEYPETTEHCLLLCPWTSAVWFGSSLDYVPENKAITNLDEWLLSVHKKKPFCYQMAKVIFCSLCAFTYGKSGSRDVKLWWRESLPAPLPPLVTFIGTSENGLRLNVVIKASMLMPLSLVLISFGTLLQMLPKLMLMQLGNATSRIVI